jgi:hypothetical protein
MKKLKSLKVGGVQKEEEEKKNMFCELKILFFSKSCYFFIIHFPLNLKNDFSSLK